MAAEVLILSKGGITYRDILNMYPEELTGWHIRLVEAHGQQYFDFDRMRWIKREQGA